MSEEGGRRKEEGKEKRVKKRGRGRGRGRGRKGKGKGNFWLVSHNLVIFTMYM